MNFRPLLFPSHAYENGPSKTVDFRNFFLRRYYFRGERGVIVTRGGGAILQQRKNYCFNGPAGITLRGRALLSLSFK